MRRVVVTGAFSYTGAAVARELLARGYEVHTLTHRRPPPDTRGITSAPLVFDAAEVSRELEGAVGFINTFWIRLPYGKQTFETAVADSCRLVEAARAEGVRFVHVSVSNASAGKNLGYYRGKAQVEEAVRRDLENYAIVRPTLVVGPGDVLTNNIAWFLRRFPVFPLPDGGRARLQPVTLADTARIIVDALEAGDPVEVDAAGPETLTFAEYLRALRDACGVRRAFVSVPNSVALGALGLVEPFLRDIVLTREELLGLEQELLTSSAPPLGTESVRQWLEQHGTELGRRYVNDIERHFGRGSSEALT